MIPKEQNQHLFLAHMEAVLDLYEKPYDPQVPVVCMDEFSKQLLEDVAAPLPMRPSEVIKRPADLPAKETTESELISTVHALNGSRTTQEDMHIEQTQTKDEPSSKSLAPVVSTIKPPQRKPGTPKRQDYEYKRNGTRNGFMMVEPLTGWRHVEITERRTLQDFAKQLQYLADIKFAEADKVIVVCDNLSGHNAGALYATFKPEEAFRLMNKIHFCHTPKHASWLNMAEIEIAALQKQCLDRRLPTEEALRREVLAWEEQRNKDQVKIQWRFSKTKARSKMHRLYHATTASQPSAAMPPAESPSGGENAA